MTRKYRGMRSCKVCGAPCHRALCGQCSPNRTTTAHQDKYAELRDEAGDQAPLGGGFEPADGGFDYLPEGF
jgi:hypothetical protein